VLPQQAHGGEFANFIVRPRMKFITWLQTTEMWCF